MYDSLTFSVKCLENSFYTIIFFPDIMVDGMYYGNQYFTFGIPRLFTFPTKNSNENNNQIILTQNINQGLNVSKTVNFQFLDCKMEVFDYDDFTRNENKLIQNGNFFHLSPSSKNNERNMYLIKILEEDKSNYNNKVCQVYLSYKDNLEDSYNNYVDILILDNVPQQMIFNKNFNHVSYGYFHEKWENDLMIKYSSKHKAKYIAKIYYSNKLREKEESIMGNGIIYLHYKEWENICKESQTCFIKIDITLEKANYEENPEPILEISIKTMKEKTVNYIPKNIFIKDYIDYQKSQYYYTEIGKNEVGYVNIHFLKGSGLAVAKIVEEGKTESNPDWKNKYALPKKENAEFKMDTFTKKIKFSTDKHNCENKCYLLINVFSNIIADRIPMKRIYPFSIVIQSYPNDINSNLFPIILIPLDEYIIGSLEKRKEKDVYEYYQINLNLNKDIIVIDIHSKIQNILVNIGNKKPIINSNDFNFIIKDDDDDGYDYSVKNNVFMISKENIKSKSQNINIEDLTLTISLYSRKLNDTILKIPYSFSVRLSNRSGKDIHLINSEYQYSRDTKLSSKKDTYYQCLYLIEPDYLSNFTSLIIYVHNPYKPQQSLSIKAKYIDYEDYLFGNLDINNFDFTYNYFYGDERYIFIKNGFMQNNKLKGILVLVEGSSEEIIQFYTSFYTYYDSLYIDPGSPSIKFVPKNQLLSLNSSNILPNYVLFVNIKGKGEIYYKEIPQYLNGSISNSFDSGAIGNDVENFIIKEINEDNDSNGIVFYYEQCLTYKEISLKETHGEIERIIDESKDSSLIIIIIVCVIVVIIIALIIIVLIFYNKNKSLKNDINKVSFETDRDNYSNLIINDDNK